MQFVFSTSKKLLLSIIKVILFSLIGCLILSLVYLIPTDGLITKNMEVSVSLLEEESDYPTLMDNYNSRLDDWTDSTMLLEAASDEKISNPFKASLSSSFLGIGNLSPRDTLIKRYTNNYESEDTFYYHYQRYWHGYLVFLKPALLLFNYGTIRSFICSIQIVLYTAIIYLLKDHKHLIIPFVVLFLFLNPVSLMLSLQFSNMAILTLLVCIFILLFYKKMDNQRYERLFLIVGSLTAFFDFLTYPLITLGIPLILYIGLNYENREKIDIKNIITFSVLWAIGYVVMWSMKWVLATIITDSNVIADAIENILYRTSNISEDIRFTFFDTIYRNLGCSLQIPWFIIVLIYIALLIKIIVQKNKIYIESLLPLLFVGIYPFIWALVLKNHTYSHCFFVYRIFAISVFAFTTYISLLNVTVQGDEMHEKNRN